MKLFACGIVVFLTVGVFGANDPELEDSSPRRRVPLTSSASAVSAFSEFAPGRREIIASASLRHLEFDDLEDASAPYSQASREGRRSPLYAVPHLPPRSFSAPEEENIWAVFIRAHKPHEGTFSLHMTHVMRDLLTQLEDVARSINLRTLSVQRSTPADFEEKGGAKFWREISERPENNKTAVWEMMICKKHPQEFYIGLAPYVWVQKRAHTLLNLIIRALKERGNGFS